MKRLLLMMAGAALVAITGPLVLQLAPATADQPFDPSVPAGPSETLVGVLGVTSHAMPWLIAIAVFVGILSWVLTGQNGGLPFKESAPKPAPVQAGPSSRTGVVHRHGFAGHPSPADDSAGDTFAQVAFASAALSALALDASQAASEPAAYTPAGESGCSLASDSYGVSHACSVTDSPSSFD